MGLSIAWVAVSGMDKAAVLDQLSLVDTGEADQSNESPISCAELPGGWTLLFINRYADPILAEPSLQALSSEGTALACQVEEHVMVSAACCLHLGKRAWSLEHDSQRGVFDLDATGDLPPAFASLRDELLAQQRADGGDAADVDHVFDVPVALAQSVCGYRHDEVALRSGEVPRFTRLASTGTHASAGARRESLHARTDGSTPRTPETPSLARWAQVPLGLLVALILLPCLAGSVMLAVLPNESAPIGAPVCGALMTLACLWLFTLCWRLVTGRRTHGGLMGPRALRLVGWFFLLMPVGGLFTGFIAEHPVQAAATTAIYISVFLALRSLARRRDRQFDGQAASSPAQGVADAAD